MWSVPSWTIPSAGTILQEAFEAERERWKRAGAAQSFDTPDNLGALFLEDAIPEGCRPMNSRVTASVWNVAVQTGERVEAGQKLVVLEAMKMEIAVAAPSAGTVEMLNCTAGALVTPGQRLITLRKDAAL